MVRDLWSLVVQYPSSADYNWELLRSLGVRTQTTQSAQLNESEIADFNES